MEINGEILFLNFKPIGGKVVFWVDNTLVIDNRVNYLIPYTEFRKHFYMQQAPRKRLLNLILDSLGINSDDKNQVALIQDQLNEIYTELGIELNALEEEDKNQSTTDKLISIASERCTLFKDQFNNGFAAIQNGEDDEEKSLAVYPIKSKFFKQWLSYEYYKLTAKAPNNESLNSAFNVLLGQAVFKGERIHLYNRVAGNEEKIYYDLTWNNWRIVEITPGGWHIIPHSTPIFRRYEHQKPAVYPDTNAKVGDFKRLLNYVPLQEKDDSLFLVHVLSFFIPNIPHPAVVLYGSQGSGKSTVFQQLRMLVDPSNLEKTAIPKDKKEFIQILAHHYFIPLDNVGSISEEKSDIISRTITGGGISKRQLYTDDDDIIYNFMHCIGINGINVVTTKPDLLDRSILYEFERIPPQQRKEEKKILKEFREDLPLILGGAFTVISNAMNHLLTVRNELNQLPRMADFTVWGEAISRSLGYEPMRFYNSYLNKIKSQNMTALENNVVGELLLEFLKDKDSWQGTANELLNELEDTAELLGLKIGKGFPKSPNALSRKLNELKVNLIDEGYKITKQRNSRQRLIIIEKTVTTVTSSLNRREMSDDIGDNEKNDIVISSPKPQISDDKKDIVTVSSPLSSPHLTGVSDDNDANDDIFLSSFSPLYNMSLNEKIQELYNYIEDIKLKTGKPPTKTAILTYFDSTFIDSLVEHGDLVELPGKTDILIDRR